MLNCDDTISCNNMYEILKLNKEGTEFLQIVETDDFNNTELLIVTELTTKLLSYHCNYVSYYNLNVLLFNCVPI